MIDTSITIMHSLQGQAAYKTNPVLLYIHLFFTLHGYTVFAHKMCWLVSVIVSVLFGVLPHLFAVVFSPLPSVFLYLFWCPHYVPSHLVSHAAPLLSSSACALLAISASKSIREGFTTTSYLS
jgi:hypothetical protein